MTAPIKDLGNFGWVTDDRVAGWILLTEGSVAIIEGLISNPNTLPSQRRHSTKVLAAFLVETALALGYKNIAFASKHPNVIAIAENMGFKETDLKFYTLTDGDEERNDYGKYRVDKPEEEDF